MQFGNGKPVSLTKIQTFRSGGWFHIQQSYVAYDAEGRQVTVGSVRIVHDAFNRAAEQNSGSSHSQVVYDPQGATLA